ncbi:MAG: DUF92 domain-containing protein [Lewinella sp.]|nr:DUF92 domain-containing protein [Lewinella sp.]
MIVLLGWGGMWIDSLLGATLQRQYYDGSRWSDQASQTVLTTRGWASIDNDGVNLMANALVVGLVVCITVARFRAQQQIHLENFYITAGHCTDSRAVAQITSNP